MFRLFKEKATLIFTLLILSIGMYYIHYVIFDNLKETVSNVVLSLAYVPIGIFYNILIIDRILEARDKLTMGKKMNMIIGTFFFDIGTDLLMDIIQGDTTVENIRGCSYINNKWTEENFTLLKNTVKQYKCIINIDKIDLDSLKNKLNEKDEFILSLITNPMLDEYEEFSEMLIATLHVKDELNSRVGELGLKAYEKKHLTKDICKAYVELIHQWVYYMEHLKLYYPSMFVKALINSPFDNRPKEVKDKEYLQLSDEDFE